jgi:outer membrane protein OmpA-like peptidoglycan-associated protein
MKKTISLIISLFVISACNTTKQPTVVTEEPPKVSGSKSCDDYQVDVGENLNRISSLRDKLKRLDCPVDKIETRMSNIAAAKAQKFLKSGNLAMAKNILTYKYAPKNSWLTQAVRGEMYAKYKDWKTAALFYNQSLDLIADKEATPNKPSKDKIERIYHLATEAQLLAGTINITFKNNSKTSGIIRDVNELGIVVKQHPIPVQFEYDKTLLTTEGQQSAKQLAEHLINTYPAKITLIGHTDPRGLDSYNCRLSRGHAIALKDYLINAGIQSGIIETIGKGETEPYKVYDVSQYTEDEINQIHRRVEFSVDDDVLRNNAC